MKPVSGKRMCKILEALGWSYVRSRGSHFQYQEPATGRKVAVPVHANDDLKPGTQKQIMRAAGLNDEDL